MNNQEKYIRHLFLAYGTQQKGKNLMSPIPIKDCIKLPMLMLFFFGFMIDMASASIEAKINQPLPVKNDFLQFRAGNHIMGFTPDKVYFANTASFFSVEFLGAHAVLPLAVSAGTIQSEKNTTQLSSSTPFTPDNGKFLAALQRVEYPYLWNGITLRYDAAKDGLAESTYFIQPGADVANIRLKYNTDTELQKNGSLKIELPTQQGYITESVPVAWQIIDGKKIPVQVAYEIKDGIIGFKTGGYNKNYELIIDPTYQWHTFYGSAAASDYGLSMAVDGNGNIYVTGGSYATWGTPLHAHSGNGTGNIVIVKMNSSGTYQWHTFYGPVPPRRASGNSIAVDDADNIYVTGNSGDWGTPLWL